MLTHELTPFLFVVCPLQGIQVSPAYLEDQEDQKTSDVSLEQFLQLLVLILSYVDPLLHLGIMLSPITNNPQ